MLGIIGAASWQSTGCGELKLDYGKVQHARTVAGSHVGHAKRACVALKRSSSVVGCSVTCNTEHDPPHEGMSDIRPTDKRFVECVNRWSSESICLAD